MCHMTTMQPPESLFGWKIGPLLGEGSCGTVFEATCCDGIEAAAKIIFHTKKLKQKEFNLVNLSAKESNVLSSTQSLLIFHIFLIYINPIVWKMRGLL